MKYAIWRHENALGNSAEHTVGLSKHLHRIKDEYPIIYYEKDFQKYFAMCISNIKEENLFKFKEGIFENVPNHGVERTFKENVLIYDDYKDIHWPSCYSYNGLSYNSMWEDLNQTIDAKLEFPVENYNNIHNIPNDIILIQIREPNTYWKRVDGANCEPERFVNINTYFNIAIYFADKGYTVFRIGDSNQTPMPTHKNIIDFAMVNNKTMLDDLYALSVSKVFLSCDSGIWPMAGGMKKNLVLSNVVSGLNKPVIVNWLPKETTKVLFKKLNLGNYIDNSFEELIESVEYFLS